MLRKDQKREKKMLRDNEDIICAMASGLGESAIGIVRVSGVGSVELVDSVFRGKRRLTELTTYSCAYGRIYDGDDILDEVIVIVMRGPHTYTTEDTVEIDCHGGPMVMRRIMELLVSRGARAAMPGEFTKRAYMGGRIDMAEAEAVMDVIHAQNTLALRASVRQLSGELSRRVRELREALLHETAYVEAALDDPENYTVDRAELLGVAEKVGAGVAELLSHADEGRLLKEGISTAIIGRPNVGKSSLLNLLLGEERAIVTDIPGTTRDTLEEYVNIGDLTLRLIDTAGIRSTDDVVEQIGVERARSTVQDADLRLLLLDATTGITDEDAELLRMAIEQDRPTIILINKTDTTEVSTDLLSTLDDMIGDYADVSVRSVAMQGGDAHNTDEGTVGSAGSDTIGVSSAGSDTIGVSEDSTGSDITGDDGAVIPVIHISDKNRCRIGYH